MEKWKKVTGRIKNIEISRYIENFQSEHPEEINTTKREIRDEFERRGYNRDLVEFDN